MAASRDTKQQQGIVQAKAEGAALALGLQKMERQISEALPKHITAERMIRLGLTAMQKTPKLMLSEPKSFYGAILQAAQLGLEPNNGLGECYLLPFKKWDKKTRTSHMETQLIIGYQGMITLAYRSGQVDLIYAHPVYEGDFFEYEFGLSPNLKHRPGPDYGDGKHPLTGVYAVAQVKGSGSKIFRALSASAVERYRERSKSSNDGPWVTDYDAMAMKTAVRRLFPWIPKSIEIATAVQLETAAENGRSQVSMFDERVHEQLSSAGYEVVIDPDDDDDEGDLPPVNDPKLDGHRMKLPKKDEPFDPRTAKPETKVAASNEFLDPDDVAREAVKDGA